MTNKILTVHFTTSGLPVTGLNPIINIYELNLTDPSINTLIINNGITTEIGQGWYRYDFSSYDPIKSYTYVFDGGNTLTDWERFKAGKQEELPLNIWDDPSTNHLISGTMGFMLTQVKSDTTSTMISQSSITSLINLLLKYEMNKTKIDPATATLTIYDDDCTTILHQFNLKDSLGNPSISEICERSPVNCP